MADMRPSVSSLIANLEQQLLLHLELAPPTATEIQVDVAYLRRWAELASTARALATDLIPPSGTPWELFGGAAIGIMIGLAAGMLTCWK